MHLHSSAAHPGGVAPLIPRPLLARSVVAAHSVGAHAICDVQHITSMQSMAVGGVQEPAKGTGLFWAAPSRYACSVLGPSLLPEPARASAGRSATTSRG